MSAQLDGEPEDPRTRSDSQMARAADWHDFAMPNFDVWGCGWVGRVGGVGVWVGRARGWAGRAAGTYGCVDRVHRWAA